MKCISIIPARAGSKGILGKNIKFLGGYPLIAYSIVVSKMSLGIERTIVSTDSQEIADIAIGYGAEVPFLRPARISRDKSTDLEFIQYAIDWFNENERWVPEYIVLLRPTTPLRHSDDIESAIIYLERYPKATSLRSAHALPEPPQKMFKVDKEGYFRGFFPRDPRPDYHNMPRQSFPVAYQPNGYVDIIKTETIRTGSSLWGLDILAFVTQFAPEADLPESFEYLEYCLARDGSSIHDYLKENFPKEYRS